MENLANFSKFKNLILWNKSKEKKKNLQLQYINVFKQ